MRPLKSLVLPWTEPSSDSITTTLQRPSVTITKTADKSLLAPGGSIHLKTDSPQLFEFTRFIAGLYDLPIDDETDDLYARSGNSPEMEIQTHYEKLDIAESRRIYYMRLRLPENPIPMPGPQLQELLKQIENVEAAG